MQFSALEKNSASKSLWKKSVHHSAPETGWLEYQFPSNGLFSVAFAVSFRECTSNLGNLPASSSRDPLIPHMEAM